MRNTIFAAAIACAAFAAPASAQGAVDPDHLMELLDGAGFPAENFSEEADYRQILVSKPGSHQFMVELFDCEGGKSCDTMEFFVGIPMDNPPTREALAAFDGAGDGAEVSFDRKGAPRMIYTVTVPDDGLTDAAFLEQVQAWEGRVKSFQDFLAGKPAAAQAPAAAAGAPATDAGAAAS
jgi:hypothetical protein